MVGEDVSGALWLLKSYFLGENILWDLVARVVVGCRRDPHQKRRAARRKMR